MTPRTISLICVALALATAGPGFVRAAAPNSAPVVELPPLLVSEAKNPLAWRYAESPGLEVLSLCPDATTEDFMEQFHHLRLLLQLILPAELQIDDSVPMVHLLGETNMGDRLKQDVQVEMFQGHGTSGSSTPDSPFVGRGAPAPRVQVLPNLRLMDTDAYTIFALLDSKQVGRRQLALTPDYVSFLLQRRVPPLPTWFIAGTMRAFNSLTFGEREVSIAPALWISEEATRAVRKDPAAAAASLLPMEDLMLGPRPPEGPGEATEAYRYAWVAQACLFTRWALDGRSPAQRQAYFKFVDRASTEPVTEAQFRETFGLTYAEMRAQLGRYLPGALDKTVRLRVSEPIEPLVLKLRPATPAETARLKGDWERMETGFVKRSYPALSGKYLDQARRTFHRAYDLGERDPRLLAAMGLTECDAGNDAAAEPFLAAAVEARVVRPRAYYELARILYTRARAAPAGPKGKLSAAQTTAVVEPLLVAQRLSPPVTGASELFADIWFHSESTPLPTDLVQLNQATGAFPKDFILNYETALLDAQVGDWSSARRVIERGFASAVAPAAKERFAQLQSLLPPAPPPAPATLPPG